MSEPEKEKGKKDGRGRVPLFVEDPSIYERIMERRRKGGNEQQCAWYALVSEKSIRNWNKWGKQGKEPFVQFYKDWRYAFAEWELDMVTKIEKAKSWLSKKYLLDRMSPAFRKAARQVREKPEKMKIEVKTRR